MGLFFVLSPVKMKLKWWYCVMGAPMWREASQQDRHSLENQPITTTRTATMKGLVSYSGHCQTHLSNQRKRRGNTDRVKYFVFKFF